MNRAAAEKLSSFCIRSCHFFLLLTLAGCSTRGPEPEGVIGVSLLTLTNPFFRDVADAMREEAARHRYDVIITSGENLVAAQLNQVDNFLTKRVDAMVLFPCDSKAIGTAIAKANRAEVPVFTADIACMAKEARVTTHVASDNFGGGRAAAQAVAEMLSGQGKIAILDFPEVESVIMRTRGFLEEIKKTPGVEVVAILPGGGDKAKSFKAAEDVLQSHPDLNGIFAINDPSALGAVAAVEKAGRSRQVQIVGFDAMPEGRYAVKQGKLYATIVQYPDKIGRTTIDVIARYMAGEHVPPQVLIPCTIYRKADAEKDKTLRE
jgi:ribose transport system substrate-binding protein